MGADSSPTRARRPDGTPPASCSRHRRPRRMSPPATYSQPWRSPRTSGAGSRSWPTGNRVRTCTPRWPAAEGAVRSAPVSTTGRQRARRPSRRGCPAAPRRTNPSRWPSRHHTVSPQWPGASSRPAVIRFAETLADGFAARRSAKRFPVHRVRWPPRGVTRPRPRDCPVRC